MAHPAFRQVVRIVSAGVPFDEAWNMAPAMRIAWCVALGENDGGSFDWHAGRWREPPK